MVWADLGFRLLELLLPIIAALITVLIAIAIAYLNKRVQRIGNDIARESLDAAIWELRRVASNAVKNVNQVYVDDIKASRADGKLTEEEKKQAMLKAKMYFANQIPDGIESVLEKSLGPIENWLDDYLETLVAEEKKSFGGVIG
jgi:hypothetical protein